MERQVARGRGERHDRLLRVACFAAIEQRSATKQLSHQQFLIVEGGLAKLHRHLFPA